MSQSQLRASDERSTDDRAAELAFGDGTAGDLLAALTDARCREIVEATDREPLSATEVAETCDIPLSTTYRKLETLTDAGLLVERTRISPTGSHPSEYRTVVDEIVLSVDGENGLALSVSRDANAEPAPMPTPIVRR